MTRAFFLACLFVIAALLSSACQKQEEPPAPTGTTQTTVPAAPEPAVKAGADADSELPPSPPIKENFEGEPKLSLFPRVGDFSPEEDDQEGQALWRTYLEHLIRTSGPIKGENGTGFAIRRIKNIDSSGFFSPLAVKPDTGYQVTFRVWTNLPEGGVGGAGILEFDQFLWIGDQFPRSLSEKHYQGAQTGVKLTGKHEGKTQSFSFRSGPQTRMIHLVFFREGTPSREPLVIDDIEIREN